MIYIRRFLPELEEDIFGGYTYFLAGELIANSESMW